MPLNSSGGSTLHWARGEICSATCSALWLIVGRCAVVTAVLLNSDARDDVVADSTIPRISLLLLIAAVALTTNLSLGVEYI